jgi:hypothetical protein
LGFKKAISVVIAGEPFASYVGAPEAGQKRSRELGWTSLWLA